MDDSEQDDQRSLYIQMSDQGAHSLFIADVAVPSVGRLETYDLPATTPRMVGYSQFEIYIVVDT
jgi:hypothetical protein